MNRILLSSVPLGDAELRAHLDLRDRTHVREHDVAPALVAGLIDLTIPHKPRCRLQRDQLTPAGKALFESLRGGRG